MKKIYLVLSLIIAFSTNNLASIAIGCCGGNDISIWRYWELINGELKEKMLILNEDSLSTSIKFTVSTIKSKSIYQHIVDVHSFGIVGGPWEIPANQYIIIDPPRLNTTDSSKYYYKISKIKKDTSIVCGYISPYNDKPALVNDSLIYYSSQSINQVESRYNDFWWEYNILTLKSGQETTINLKILEKRNVKEECKLKRILIFKWSDSVSQRNIFPINVKADKFIKHYIYSRDTLDYWNRSLEYILSYKVPLVSKDHSESVYTLGFKIVAPKVTKQETIFVSVFVDKGVCSKEFDLPLIVKP